LSEYFRFLEDFVRKKTFQKASALVPGKSVEVRLVISEKYMEPTQKELHSGKFRSYLKPLDSAAKPF